MAAAAATLAIGLAGCGEVDCDDFRFDQEEWAALDGELTDEAAEERSETAEALLRCRTLIGRERAEVRDLLGPPHERQGRGTDWWYLRDNHVGDSVLLTVHYVRGRVLRVDIPH